MAPLPDTGGHASGLSRAYPAAGGVALLHSPVSFDLTVTALFTPLVVGGTVLLAELAENAALGDRPVTFMKATPSHLPLLVALPDAYSPTTELLLGGEALTGEALATWRDRHPAATVWNVYGPTETTVNCTEYRIDPGTPVPPGPVPVGRPQGNVRAYVLDSHLRPVPSGVAGELYGGSAREDPGVARDLLHATTRLGPARGYYYQLISMLGWTSLPRLPRLRPPTLILAGDDDPIIPVVNARIMHRLIPRSKLHVYHGGHLELAADSERLAAAVEAFLDTDLTAEGSKQ